MIYDGLLKLVNSGDIEEAQSVISSLLDFTTLNKAIEEGKTVDQYITQVFRDVGVA